MSLEDDARTIDRAAMAERVRREQLPDRQVALLEEIARNTARLSALAGLWSLVGIAALAAMLLRSCT